MAMQPCEMAHPPVRTIGSIGWYIHLPFCTTKCGYCDFYSLPTKPELIPDLAAAIRREIELRDPHRPIRTVFVGGGTPTVLPADALQSILSPISERVREQPDPVEFSCEANPSSADELKLDLLRNCGVNRISFGAQSFDRSELAVLQRIHDPSHISDAVRWARAAGFDNVNLDLIFGVPGQTTASWLNSLRRAIELNPDHISCYGLMYEDGTALTRQRRLGLVQPCDEDVEAEMFERTTAELARAGYEQYEISNYAKPGKRCEHNLIYWRNEEYLGIGPSAVSYLDGVRQKTAPDVAAYVRGYARAEQPVASLVIEREQLTPDARARETAVQMLRLVDGIDLQRFRDQTGFDPAACFKPAIDKNQAAGLLESRTATLRLTRAGMLLANQVMMDFV